MIISASSTNDPNFLVMSVVFFPINPRPAFTAKAFSSKGLLSTQAYVRSFGSRDSMYAAICFKIFFKTLW